MASTGEKTIHGKSHAFGAKNDQVGGHVSDDTIQQALRVIGGILAQLTGWTVQPWRKRLQSFLLTAQSRKLAQASKAKGSKLHLIPPAPGQCLQGRRRTNLGDD